MEVAIVAELSHGVRIRGHRYSSQSLVQRGATGPAHREALPYFLRFSASQTYRGDLDPCGKGEAAQSTEGARRCRRDSEELERGAVEHTADSIKCTRNGGTGVRDGGEAIPAVVLQRWHGATKQIISASCREPP